LSSLTLDDVKRAMVAAGLEIYRVTGGEVRVAERVRMHLMDSGVTVCIAQAACASVSVTVRSQRSDFPNGRPDELYEMIRRAMKSAAEDRGFREVTASSRDVTDPVDKSSILDVWHELTFAKDVDRIDTLIDDVQWALAVPKCVTP
jgi:hypothetical protein